MTVADKNTYDDGDLDDIDPSLILINISFTQHSS